MTALSTKHLTGISDLEDADIESILLVASHYAENLEKGDYDGDKLKNKLVMLLFFENSTRTRTSFDMAACRLGADVVLWDVGTSSIKKGESFIDTIRTLGDMRPDAIILRHYEAGAPLQACDVVECPIINAGDSAREHPSQALLDALTLKQYFGSLEGLTVSIVGDIAHSRVAHSNMILLTRMGASVRLIAPPALMPGKFPVAGVETYASLEEGLPGADAVMTIRPQKERMQEAMIDDREYFENFCMSHARLDMAGGESVLLDPGPFLRGLMITDELADDRGRFLYDRQVFNGVPTRMAILDLLLSE